MHTIPNQVDIVPLAAYSQKCAGHAVVLLRDLAENITRLLLHYLGLTLDGEAPQGKQTIHMRHG